MTVAPGTTIGRYEVLHKLGAGGMGGLAAWCAERLGLGARTSRGPRRGSPAGVSCCPPEREARTTVLNFRALGRSRSVLRTLADRMSALRRQE